MIPRWLLFFFIDNIPHVRREMTIEILAADMLTLLMPCGWWIRGVSESALEFLLLFSKHSDPWGCFEFWGVSCGMFARRVAECVCDGQF